MSVNDMLLAAAGASAGGDKLYIESVFSTHLYTGNGSTQTITNGIDLDGEGGLVWVKSRSSGTFVHNLYDTNRGTTKYLLTSSILSQQTVATTLTSFNSDGFSISSRDDINANGATFASWTFRKAPKFFDCVTYTGTGSARTVAHNLGSVPGCIIVKAYDGFSDWYVYHRANTANPETDYLVLNTTAATADLNTIWNDTAPTDSVFSVGSGDTNTNGVNYVAYLFAHDAGGFGDDGEQNVISCGSFTANDGAAQSINLGYEPQWLLIKSATSAASWFIRDTMRGWTTDGTTSLLSSDTSNAETSGTSSLAPNATGFQHALSGTNTFIYIAIRRGPMKTPTSGTEVFGVNNLVSSLSYISGFPVDMAFERLLTSHPSRTSARLIQGKFLDTDSTAAEGSASSYAFDSNTQWFNTTGGNTTRTSQFFRRAPGFFDVVCYTGTGVARTVDHNLGVAPELMIFKRRDSATDWWVYSSSEGAGRYTLLNYGIEFYDDTNFLNNTAPTSSVFTVGTTAAVNQSAGTFVAYLFASLAGVSKVGSYTGTGTTLAIDCGFSAGARFVMIKRTDSTGDWYYWDYFRGIVAGNDPYLLMNSQAAEVTSTDYIDPSSAGFEISSTAPAAINASGGNFVFLAVA